VETEEAVRRQSEAEIRHEEGFEVISRRRGRRATGGKTKSLVEEVGLCRSSSKEDVSCCGVQQFGGRWSAKAQGGEGGSNSFQLYCSSTRAKVRHRQG